MEVPQAQPEAVPEPVAPTRRQRNEEYFSRLEQWLNEVRICNTHSFNFLMGIPYYMTGRQLPPLPPMPPQPPQCDLNFPWQLFNAFPLPPADYANQAFGQMLMSTIQQAVQPPGIIMRIPPLWKRFVAELVDFLILFIIKLAITFIAVDFFDFVDLDKYDIELLQQQDKLDYKLAIEMTSEILFLELIHRLIVCVYEGIALHRGVHTQIGGATPGKTLMGLRVVMCKQVEQMPNTPNKVRVVPATDLGLAWSFARALLKNLVLALLFPICLPLFFNKFNRTGYDILCNSIVVENDRVPYDRNR